MCALKKKQVFPHVLMDHVPLDQTPQHKIIICAAHDATTIHHLVVDLIRREAGESNRNQTR